MLSKQKSLASFDKASLCLNATRISVGDWKPKSHESIGKCLDYDFSSTGLRLVFATCSG